jgi:hypothetical protein
LVEKGGPHKKETHANWDTVFPLPEVQLPKEMMGYWCQIESDNQISRYTKADGPEECERKLSDTLQVRPYGWDEVWDHCPFTKVEKEPNGAYLIYSYCEMLAEGDGHGIGQYFSEHFEYRMEDGQLVVTQIPET